MAVSLSHGEGPTADEVLLPSPPLCYEILQESPQIRTDASFFQFLPFSMPFSDDIFDNSLLLSQGSGLCPLFCWLHLILDTLFIPFSV